MSKLIKSHLPCPDCQSSDALAQYEDGHTFCFSCGVYTPAGGPIAQGSKSETKIRTKEYQGLTDFFPFPANKYLTSFSGSGTIDSKESEEKVKGSSEGVVKEKEESRPTVSTLKDSISILKDGCALEHVAQRGLTIETLRKYGVKTSTDKEGNPLATFFPYGPHNNKIRDLTKVKSFLWQVREEELPQDKKRLPLFGMDKFPAGSSKTITITEGEYDALSSYQMQGSKYPVVSVSSSTTAEGEAKQAHAYLNSFDMIYLNFDNDNPGIEAAKKVARLFNPNKVYIVPYDRDLKDANDYLTEGRAQDYTKLWWSASTFKPANIINRLTEVKDLIFREDAEAIATFPFPSLDSKAFGIRSKEVVLLTAQEKVGKTEILRAIEHHLLKTTDYNLGIIHLEESERRAVLGLVNYELKKPVHLPHSGVSREEMFNTYEKLMNGKPRVNIYSHYDSDEPDVILETIRYMVQVQGCKFVFLDHITWLVTGIEGDDERRKLDYISTKLAKMTKDLDFCLFLVSHVNDDNRTRGSRNISKIADLLVYIDRDIENADDLIRNTTNVTLKGNRFAGLTGPCTALLFDTKTYTLHEMKQEDVLNHAIPF